jgi:hypothetical protein
MKNQSQQAFVINELKKKGYITRNECLGNYISRLGAIILDLKNKGFKFIADYHTTAKGKDYVYKIDNPEILKDY